MIEVLDFLNKCIYVELICKNRDNVDISAISTILLIDETKLRLDKTDEIIEFVRNLHSYAKLNVIIYSQDGVLHGDVNLLNVSEDYIEISFPYNNKISQRRENLRIPMHVDCELSIINGKKFLLKSKNISGKGVAFITEEKLPEFSDANMVLYMPTKDVVVKAKKIYSKEISMNSKKAYLSGISFFVIDETDVSVILKDSLKFQLNSLNSEKLFEVI